MHIEYQQTAIHRCPKGAAYLQFNKVYTEQAASENCFGDSQQQNNVNWCLEKEKNSIKYTIRTTHNLFNYLKGVFLHSLSTKWLDINFLFFCMAEYVSFEVDDSLRLLTYLG